MATNNFSTEPWTVPVGRKTMQAATILSMDYLIPHALAAFEMMGCNPRTANITSCTSLEWEMPTKITGLVP